MTAKTSNKKKTFSLDHYLIDEEDYNQAITPEIPVCIPRVPFRIHPNIDRVAHVFICLINNRWHLVSTELAKCYRIPKLWQAQLFEGIDHEGNTFIVPLTRSTLENESWHDSLDIAINRARKQWMTIETSHEDKIHLGVPAITKLSNPCWPEHDFADVLELAFKDRSIDNHAEADRLFSKRRQAEVIEDDC